MVTVYVLALQRGKYYVGRTKNPYFKIHEDFDPYNTAWTTVYKPLYVLQLIEDYDNIEEDKFVKLCMKNLGIENVRGGSYKDMYLDTFTQKQLKRELNS